MNDQAPTENKISYDIIGKDAFTNQKLQLSVFALDPSDVKNIMSKKHPRVVIDVIYPSKYGATIDQ